MPYKVGSLSHLGTPSTTQNMSSASTPGTAPAAKGLHPRHIRSDSMMTHVNGDTGDYDTYHLQQRIPHIEKTRTLQAALRDRVESHLTIRRQELERTRVVRELSAAQDQLQQSNEQNYGLRSELETLKAQHEIAQERISSMSEQLGDKDEQLHDAARQLMKSEERLEATERSLDEREEDLRATQFERDEAQEESDARLNRELLQFRAEDKEVDSLREQARMSAERILEFEEHCRKQNVDIRRLKAKLGEATGVDG